MLIALILAAALAQTAPGATLDHTEPPGANFDKAEFRLWMPDGVDRVQATLVLVPGSNGDGRPMADDPFWQEFATQQQLALVACRFTDKPHDQIVHRGIRQRVARAAARRCSTRSTARLASKHPELATAPLLLWGMSAGGQFDYEFVAWKPERVAAFVVNKGGIYYTALAPKAAREVPGLLFIGEKDLDSRINTISGLSAVNRRGGALWALTEEPGVGARRRAFARARRDPLRGGSAAAHRHRRTRADRSEIGLHCRSEDADVRSRERCAGRYGTDGVATNARRRQSMAGRGQQHAVRSVTSGAAAPAHVAIVGSGFGGLGAAIRLKRDGIDDFVILERAGDVGGTWRDNTYPGCACDVESHLYSLSFALEPGWTRRFSRQPEIWRYLQRLARDHDLLSHIRFHHEVRQADWDAAARCWRIDTSQGAVVARTLVVATGPLSAPSVPDLPGLDAFQGRAFHSANWDHAYDLAGKRVAVVGTGASAVQFIPEIRKRADRVTVFQRTPAWVIPRPDAPIPEWRRRLYARMPAVQRAVRFLIYLYREAWIVVFRHPAVMRRVQKLAERFLEQ